MAKSTVTEAKTYRKLDDIMKDYQQQAFNTGDRVLKIRTYEIEIEKFKAAVDELDKEYFEAKKYWDVAAAATPPAPVEATDAANH